MTPGPRKRLYLGSALILVLGLFAAVVIYATTGDDSDRAVGYEVINGVAYPVAPADSKAYQRELERFGGKANVLAAEFTEWFAGLWRGRRLAWTIGILSALVSLGLYLTARALSDEGEQ